MPASLSVKRRCPPRGRSLFSRSTHGCVRDNLRHFGWAKAWACRKRIKHGFAKFARRAFCGGRQLSVSCQRTKIYFVTATGLDRSGPGYGNKCGDRKCGNVFNHEVDPGVARTRIGMTKGSSLGSPSCFGRFFIHFVCPPSADRYNTGVNCGSDLGVTFQVSDRLWKTHGFQFMQSRPCVPVGNPRTPAGFLRGCSLRTDLAQRSVLRWARHPLPGAWRRTLLSR